VRGVKGCRGHKGSWRTSRGSCISVGLGLHGEHGARSLVCCTNAVLITFFWPFD
jgi:hypothetical protein